jgi:TonB family protein
MRGKGLLLGVALLLLVARFPASPQAKPEECYCSAGAGGAAYGLTKSGTDTARCTGLRVAYRMKDVDRRAKIIERAEPSYTEAARENQVEGVVRLLVVLCPSGAVSNVKVVKGLPDGLTEKAISAARQIRFTPAEKDGRNVSQYVVLEYNFNIY